MRCIVDRHGVHSDYYGLEMIAAVAFRVKSWQANKFRRWLMERVMRSALNPGSLPSITVIVPVREEMLPN
jgi:prophage antirepressor-like protein